MIDYSKAMELHSKMTRLFRAMKGAAVGLVWRQKGVVLHGRINVMGATPCVWSGGLMQIGHRVQFRNITASTSLTCHTNAELSIGNRCSINEGVQIDCWSKIAIGAHSRIGPGCFVCDTSYHEVDEASGATMQPIEIGQNVWLSRNVTILPGVSIGDHSVVAAGTVVTRSFPERSLIAGVPARKVRDISASNDYVRP